jgi:hypothetical protein
MLDWDNIKDEPRTNHLEAGCSDGTANCRGAREAVAEARSYIQRHWEDGDDE